MKIIYENKVKKERDINFCINVPNAFATIICLSPIVDVLTGFCKLTGLSGGDISSIIFKAFLSFICICYCMCYSNLNEWIKYILILILVILSIFWHISFAFGIRLIFNDLYFYFKLFFPVLLYAAMDKLMKKRLLLLDDIKSILGYFAIFIPLSIIIPKILGMGFYTYENMESGFRGFYYGGNGINILAIILLLISGEYFIQFKSLKSTVLVIINIISVILIGTKTSIISIVFFMLMLLRFLENKKKLLVITEVILCCIFMAVLLYHLREHEFFLSIFYRLNYEYRRVNGNLVDFITNSRIKQGIPYLVDVVKSSNVFFDLLFGVGYTQYQKVVEMDFLDIGLHYGIFILLFITRFYIKCFRKCKVSYIRYAFIFSMMYACFAGHLLISPMGSMILVIYCLKGKYQKRGAVNGFKNYSHI